jgi:signal transduction histidine kinase
MKLLQKTNRIYLILSAAAFTFAGILVYFVLSLILDSQLNEKLSDTKAHLIENIRDFGIISNDPPYIEVKEKPGGALRGDIFRDTLLFDSSENEDVPSRQLTGTSIINGKYYEISVRSTLIEKSDILITLIIIIGIVFFMLLVALFFINKKTSQKIWQPFYHTINKLKGFSQDDPSFAIKGTSDIEEFKELNLALNKLTSKVISDYQLLKRFTEDASHEIQTPLSIIQSKLESLLQDPLLKKTQAEQIHAAYSASVRLSQLTRSMLFLSRIENRQFPGSEKVNLSLILSSLTDLFEETARKKSLVIEQEIEPGCILDVSPLLVESFFTNLVGNAIKHSVSKSKISIRLNQKAFIIENKGNTLSVQPEKLFERFYKDNKSSDNFGLGLSIVKEICRVYNWRINYTIEEEIHKIIVFF